MTRRNFYLIIALLLPICACQKCSNGQTSTPPSSESSAEGIKSEADSNDLLDALQGRWQSEQDESYVLEIVGSKMRHLNNGKLSAETDIEVDSKCLTTACAVDSLAQGAGWCFVEKGQFDAQCNLVVKCDSAVLLYRSLGAASGLTGFKRM